MENFKTSRYIVSTTASEEEKVDSKWDLRKRCKWDFPSLCGFDEGKLEYKVYYYLRLPGPFEMRTPRKQLQHCEVPKWCKVVHKRDTTLTLDSLSGANEYAIMSISLSRLSSKPASLSSELNTVPRSSSLSLALKGPSLHTFHLDS